MSCFGLVLGWFWGGFRWLLVVRAGYKRWVVIRGYGWLSLVIGGYWWLRVYFIDDGLVMGS